MKCLVLYCSKTLYPAFHYEGGMYIDFHMKKSYFQTKAKANFEFLLNTSHYSE